MLNSLSGWWYNYNKPYYMLPRGKDISEPITTVVEDVLENRSNYKITSTPRADVICIRNRPSGLEYRLKVSHRDTVFLYLVKNNKETSLSNLTSDEESYLDGLYRRLRGYLYVLRETHREWSSMAKRKEITKTIKDSLKR